jgi:ankyrin repeat protein
VYKAASVGHKEIAELLIAAGADVNANYHGNTVLCNVTINLTGFYEMF